MPSTLERARAVDIFADCAADTMLRSPQAFCLSLKAARERRGVSLAQIARSTKVCESHFVALERSDLRSWPKGLFRRAFFRGYVEMIGLPVPETMEEFARLFPDGDAAGTARPAADAGALRLSFDASWQGPSLPLASRIRTAMIDAGAVLVMAAAFAWLGDASIGTTAAIVSVSYFTLATMLLGDSPAASVERWRRGRAAVLSEAAGDDPVGVIARAWRSGVNVAVNVLPSAGGDAASDPVEPRLRVRFKLP
jgi:hypothetical protein